MRTSHISRETARVIDALSPLRTVGPRRSLRSFKEELERPSIKTEDGGSSPDKSDVESTNSSTLGKRKRGEHNLINGSTPRQSPRKAPKPDPGNSDDGSDHAVSRRKPRRQPSKRVRGPDGMITIEPPPGWEQLYSTTAAMRKRVLAPVDTMGCESLAEPQRSPKEQRLQTLISLMLSSQTKDTVTAAAMRNLQQNLVGGLTLESLLAVDPPELNRLIEKVGFHNNKTKFIKSVAEILRDRFAGDIPDTIEGLVSLPGVGPKMAYLCMSAAWGRDEGIGVDVHVHRITNLWGWHKTSTPEQTRAELEAWLPREKWHDINHLLVGLGQTICLPVGRRCGECDLARDKLCPSAVAGSPVKRRIKREIKIEVDHNEVVEDKKIKVEYDDAGIKVETEMDGHGIVEIQGVQQRSNQDC